MTDDRTRDESDDRPEERERARALILARRRRFMAAAVTGLGVLSTSCTKSMICLSIARPDAGGEQDAGMDASPPSVCLSMLAPDTGPFREDAGEDGATGDAATDAAAEDAATDAAAEDAATDAGDAASDAAAT